MTESEWLASTDPVRMLDWLGGTHCEGTDREGRRYAVRVSDRRWRLLGLACWAHCSRYRHDPRLIVQAYDDFERGVIGCLPLGVSAGLDVVHHLILTVNEWGEGTAAWRHVQMRKPALIRCIIGNPWQPVATEDEYLHDFAIQESLLAVSRALGRRNALDRIIRTDWLTSDVLAIARSIYDDRCFSELPILADALEDAGCPATVKCPYCSAGHIRTRLGYYECGDCDTTGRIPHPLLAHLRDPGPHVRGCHAVDCVLGKE